MSLIKEAMTKATVSRYQQFLRFSACFGGVIGIASTKALAKRRLRSLLKPQIDSFMKGTLDMDKEAQLAEAFSKAEIDVFQYRKEEPLKSISGRLT